MVDQLQDPAYSSDVISTTATKTHTNTTARPRFPTPALFSLIFVSINKELAMDKKIWKPLQRQSQYSDFLVVSQDYLRGCVRPLVHPSVRPSVHPWVSPSVRP